MAFFFRCPYTGIKIPIHGRMEYYKRRNVDSYPASKIDNPLNNTKAKKGIQGLKAYFEDLVSNNPDEAAAAINDENLYFGCLYMLKPEVEAEAFYKKLCMRNKMALGLIDELQTGSKNTTVLENSSYDYVKSVCSMLQWILVSGAEDDGLDDNYDSLLDAAALILGKVYADRTVLPAIVDMIFARNRKGFFYNDLLWAFFEARYPDSLVLIAKYIQSQQPKDVELARELLSFVPGIGSERDNNRQAQYLSVTDWLEDNIMYLYYTGESYQQTGNPIPYRVIYEGKYLNKAVFVSTGKIIETLDESEYKLLEDFSGLDDKTKIILSNYSHMLHKKDIDYWSLWMGYPVAEQIRLAMSASGVRE